MAEKKRRSPITWAPAARKTAVARVRLLERQGPDQDQRPRSETDYFTEDKDRGAVMGPLTLTDQAKSVGRDRSAVTRRRHHRSGPTRSKQGLARAHQGRCSHPRTEQKVITRNHVNNDPRLQGRSEGDPQPGCTEAPLPRPSADGSTPGDGRSRRSRDPA